MVPSADRLPDIVSTNELARVLGVTARTLGYLVEKGVLRRAAAGRYDLAESVQALIRHEREQAEKRAEKKVHDPLREKRAEELQQRIDYRKGITMLVEEHEAVMERCAGKCLEIISGLPARITSDLRERQRIESVCDDARRDLSRHFREQATEIERTVAAQAERRTLPG